MSDSHITKDALATSLKELMLSIPLEKITVKDIVVHCKLNRQTFYYHFKDKYELVYWIYYTEIIEVLVKNYNYKHYEQTLYSLLKSLQDNKSFYINALNDYGQNAFKDYFFEVTKKILVFIFDQLSCSIPMTTPDKSFCADFYAYACTGMILRWAHLNMEDPPQYVCKRLNLILDNSIFRLLDEQNYIDQQDFYKTQLLNSLMNEFKH